MDAHVPQRAAVGGLTGRIMPEDPFLSGPSSNEAEGTAGSDRLDGQSAATPYYSDEELDALYERDPIAAMRLSRAQAVASRHAQAAPRLSDRNAVPPTHEALVQVLDEARGILLRDGGDLELVDVVGTVVWVRMKGACVGCPNAVLDLRNVVERVVRARFPQITEVRNTF
ncbi:MAG: NifU family protein [Betaproteobacteria bacterium]|nr:NifU family protein [Betaproteobacteria bacterium]